MESIQRETSNLLLFSTGKLISIFGSSIYTFAIGLYVLKITGSGLSFAASMVFGLVPALILNPFAGVIADKFDKKTIVIAMDMANGIMLILLYIFTISHSLNIILIYISTFLLTVFTTFFGVGAEAAKPNLVSEKQLMNINTISKIIDSISSILGPMLGGIIFVIMDIRIFIIINGLSFIISAILEIFVDFNYNRQIQDNTEKRAKINFSRDIKEGIKYLFSHKELKSLFSMLIAVNFFLGFAVTVPLPFIINNVLKLSSRDFGIVEGAFPVGIILGALIVKKVCEKVEKEKLLYLVGYVLSTIMILLGLPLLISLKLNHIVYVLYYGIIVVTFGIAISHIDIPISYMMQKHIPDEYRGRVISIAVTFAKTMLPAALVISGILLNNVPAFTMPITGGVLFFTFNMISVARR